MIEVKLSGQQQAAVDKITLWRDNPTPMFKLFGLAGTGKTTILKYLAPQYVAAPTGKAAAVLRDKGLPQARTIHSLLYRRSEPDPAELQRIQDRIEEIGTPASATQYRELVRLQAEYEEANNQYNLRDFKGGYLAIDEASMINVSFARDILSFGVSLLICGDPGQLPPVQGEAYFMSDPDFELTEIHRQAEDNPILKLAYFLRSGGDYHKERFGIKGHRGCSVDLLAWADQVICGRHRTRCAVNRRLRNHYELELFPTGKPEERLICKRNNKRHDVYNGQEVRIEEVLEDIDELSFLAWVQAGGRRFKAEIYKGLFRDADGYDPARKIRDGRRVETLLQLDWAFAITVHSAQGSEWDRVLFLDDHLPSDRPKLLYTACTRAAKELIICDVSPR